MFGFGAWVLQAQINKPYWIGVRVLVIAALRSSANALRSESIDIPQFFLCSAPGGVRPYCPALIFVRRPARGSAIRLEYFGKTVSTQTNALESPVRPKCMTAQFRLCKIDHWLAHLRSAYPSSEARCIHCVDATQPHSENLGSQRIGNRPTDTSLQIGPEFVSSTNSR